MDLTTLIALIAATAVLVAIPGPNVALFIANTLTHGARHGVLTVLGTTIGVGVQLAVVVLGLAALLELAAGALNWVRWAGVAYLVWLGISAWRQGVEPLAAGEAGSASLRRVFWQGLLLALINPKTLLFAAAFLPQFIPAGVAGSFVLLAPAAIYLTVILLGDLGWVLLARVARPALRRLGRWRHRLTGGLFLGAGLGLALARIEK